MRRVRVTVSLTRSPRGGDESIDPRTALDRAGALDEVGADRRRDYNRIRQRRDSSKFLPVPSACLIQAHSGCTSLYRKPDRRPEALVSTLILFYGAFELSSSLVKSHELSSIIAERRDVGYEFIVEYPFEARTSRSCDCARFEFVIIRNPNSAATAAADTTAVTSTVTASASAASASFACYTTYTGIVACVQNKLTVTLAPPSRAKYIREKRRKPKDSKYY